MIIHLNPFLTLCSDRFSLHNLEHSEKFRQLIHKKPFDSDKLIFDIALSFLECLRDQPSCLNAVDVSHSDIVSFFDLLQQYTQTRIYRNSIKFLSSQVFRVIGSNQIANEVCVSISLENDLHTFTAVNLAYVLRTGGFYYQALSLVTTYLKSKVYIDHKTLCSLLKQLVYISIGLSQYPHALSVVKYYLVPLDPFDNSFKLLGDVYGYLKFTNLSSNSLSFVKKKPVEFIPNSITSTPLCFPDSQKRYFSSNNTFGDSIFIPSFVHTNFSEFSHLLFSHIPKTAGRYFCDPIFDAISFVLSHPQLNPSFCTDSITSSFLNPPRIYSGDYIASDYYLSTNIQPGLQSSFIVYHGASILYVAKSYKEARIPFRSITVTRDPRNRLKSAIQYKLRHSQSYESVRTLGETHNIFFDNSIYRHYYNDFNSILIHSNDKSSIYDLVLDQADSTGLMYLQSLLLSNWRLPNIMMPGKVNQTSSNSIPSNLHDSVFSLMDHFLELGCIDFDLKLNLTILHARSSSYISSPFHSVSSSSLHPYTLVFENSNSSFLSRKISVKPTYEVLDSVKSL